MKASTKFADPDGTEEIVRSDATARYKVKPGDLDTLCPVRTERGERNALVKYYNTGDVSALEQRLKQDPLSSKAAVKKTGGKISAEIDFGDVSQKSTSEASLPGTSKGKMKEESPSRTKDKGKSPAKQKSADDNKVIKKAPSSSKRKKSFVKRNYDYDDYDYNLMEEGMFDGMTSHNAAALLASLLR